MAIRVLTSLIACAALLSADTLVLRNGTVIEGSFIGGNSHSVRFASGDQIKSYELSDVQSVRFDNGSQQPAPPPPAPPAPAAQKPQPATPPSAPPPQSAPPPPAAPARPAANSAAVQTPPPMTPPSSAAPENPPAAQSMVQQPPPSTSPAPTAGSAAPATSASSAAPGENHPHSLEVPAGSNIMIRMIDPVNSEKDKVGQTYRASIDESVLVDGRVAIPRGADAIATLIDDQQSGKLTGKTVLTLDLKYVTVNGQEYSVVTTGVSKASGSRGARTAKMAGAGAVLGAIIGAAAGGGKGAAIGAGTGAAAGTGAELATSGQKVKIPAETRLTFTLQNPLDI